MAKFGIASGPSGTRRKIATAFAAAGALLLSSGMVVMAAAPASASHGGSHGGRFVVDADSVFVCHRTSSDTQPYNVQRVNKASAQAVSAHYDHAEENVPGAPGGGDDKYWGADVLWNGTSYEAGDFKPDRFFTGTTQEELDVFVSTCNMPADVIDDGDDDGETDRDLTLALPAVTRIESCGETGSVTRPETAGVRYLINGEESAEAWAALTEGGHTITAEVIGNGTRLVDPSGQWSVASNGKSATLVVDLGDAEACPTGLLVALDFTPTNGCNTQGRIVQPTSPYVSYQINGGVDWTVTSGSHLVTATLQAPATGFGGATDGWSISSTTTASRTVNLGTFTACDNPGGGNPGGENPGGENPGGGNPGGGGSTSTLVTPRYASTTAANCSRDGRLVVPTQPAGVLVEQTGTAPGDVTFTFAPAMGYAFPAGTDTEVTVTVPAQLGGDDCVQGVETERPEPKPGTNEPGNGPAAGPVNGGTDAEVLGEQAVAVPTAVAAGLGDTMTAATTTGSPQLAQALVAGGLLMLVAGGATGLGRRTRGAHES